MLKIMSAIPKRKPEQNRLEWHASPYAEDGQGNFLAMRISSQYNKPFISIIDTDGRSTEENLMIDSRTNSEKLIDKDSNVLLGSSVPVKVKLKDNNIYLLERCDEDEADDLVFLSLPDLALDNSDVIGGEIIFTRNFKEKSFHYMIKVSDRESFLINKSTNHNQYIVNWEGLVKLESPKSQVISKIMETYNQLRVENAELNSKIGDLSAKNDKFNSTGLFARLFRAWG